MFYLTFVLSLLKMQKFQNQNEQKKNKTVEYNLKISNCMGHKKDTSESVLFFLLVIVINRPL